MAAPPFPATGPGRRAVLRTGLAGVAAVAVLGTTSCRLRVGSPSSKPAPTELQPSPTVDELALDRASQRASGLAATYAQAVRLRPDLDAGLRQLAADHTAHVQAIQALQPVVATSTSTSGSTSGSTSSGTPSVGATGPALTVATALSALGQAERTASSAALADLAAVGSQAARLLASIAACESAHVAVLATLPARARTKSVGTSSKQAG